MEIDPAIAPPQPLVVKQEEVESIEQYMARLLERVQGRLVDAGARPSDEQEVDPTRTMVLPIPRERAPAEPERPATPAEGENRVRREISDSAPRPRPPEQDMDLNAMRALANLSARTSLDTHSLEQGLAGAKTKLLTTVAILVAAFVVVELRLAGQIGSSATALWVTAAAFACGVYNLYATRRFVRATGQDASSPPTSTSLSTESSQPGT